MCQKWGLYGDCFESRVSLAFSKLNKRETYFFQNRKLLKSKQSNLLWSVLNLTTNEKDEKRTMLIMD